MISTEDIRKKIMEMAESNKHKTTIPLDEVARQLSSENSKNSMAQVKLVADALVQEGKILPYQNNSFMTGTGKKPVL
jgi:Protein of unknown function (DUF3253)